VPTLSRNNEYQAPFNLNRANPSVRIRAILEAVVVRVHFTRLHSRLVLELVTMKRDQEEEVTNGILKECRKQGWEKELMWEMEDDMGDMGLE
jgi:hypothetical protein